MPDTGFGSGLWSNAQAVRFGPHHELLAPILADGSEGIVVGVDAVEASDATPGTEEPEVHGGFRRLAERWRRP